MRKTERMASVLLMAVMMIASVGLLYASIYASGGGSQSTFGAVLFDKETGIRYNNLTKEFEVFNEAGVSWIGSGRYISVEGVVEPSGTAGNPDQETYERADSNKTYNIMRDIGYTGTISGNNIYNTAFDSSKITLGATGIIDGRGFTLKNFKVRTMSLESKLIGSAIVAINNGTIRNLNVSNASFIGATTGVSAGIICGINKGIIDSCTTYGTDLDKTYQSSLYTGLYGIAAVTSGKISNSTNNANLNNTASNSFSAGLASVTENASLLSNINNGNITSTNRVAGIAIDAVGVVFTVRGNVNNGDLNAPTSHSGIIDGGLDLTNMIAKGNVSNGQTAGTGEVFELYYGVSDIVIEIPEYGIKWNSALVNSEGNTVSGFEIYNVDGISWISSSATFDEEGNKDSGSGTSNSTTSASYYKIADGIKKINYNGKTAGKFNTAFETTAPSITVNGEFDGNGCTLEGFDIRQCGTSGSALNHYSAFFYENRGTIQNFTMNLQSTIEVGNIQYIGGIVGYNSGGILEGLSFNGELSPIITHSNSFVGGIVANFNGGSLSNSFGFGIVRGMQYVGGLVGSHCDGVISNCAYTGDVFAHLETGFAGGIAGERLMQGIIRDCLISANIYGYYTGTVVGDFSYYWGTDMFPGDSIFKTNNDTGSHVGGISEGWGYGSDGYVDVPLGRY